MSSHDSYYGTLSSSAGPPPPPPPPPKPYSQDPSRSGTPTVSSPPTLPQNSISQSYSQQPPLPPHPHQATSPAAPQYQARPSGEPQPPPQPPYQSHPTQQQQYNTHPQHQPQHMQQGPQLPSTFDLPASITAHTTSDLSTLLSKPELLTSLAQQHPAYKASLQPLQSQITSNLTIANRVSQLESQVKQLREQIGQLMLQHTSLQTQWRRRQTEMDEALAPWGPRAMYQRLVAGINEQEAILRAVYESFLDGGGETQDYYGETANGGKATEKEVNDWVKRIREGTSVLEKRREMRARWDDGRVGGWR